MANESEEKKRRAIARLRRYSASGKMPRAGLYELAIRRKKIAKLEAERKAAAKARAARGPATTQAELDARREATKETPAPMTPSQRAAARRKRLMEGTTLDILAETMAQAERKKK